MTRFSVFTASHDPRFLDDCWHSIRSQSFQDWEWVVLLNGGATWRHDDPRVHIHSADVAGVGEAKAAAVSHCRGEILVELDHDDRLTPDALSTLDGAFRAASSPGFVYSDGAYLTESGEPSPFVMDPGHGLVQRQETLDGGRYRVIGSLAPTPHNVSYIWYAPNHVRAFTRTAYDAAGGYDPTRTVCDDQDLMSRLYQVASFHHVPACLYLQRRYDTSTQQRSEFNGTIQRQTVELYDQYIEANVRAWCKRERLHVVELRADTSTVLSGIPSDSIGLITAPDVLQRVHNPVEFFNEAHRILKHGGLLITTTPSTDGRGAFQDPTHRSFFNENSFWYYTDAAKAGFVPGLLSRFQLSRLTTYFPDAWHEQHQISYVNANLISIKQGPRQGGVDQWNN